MCSQGAKCQLGDGTYLYAVALNNAWRAFEALGVADDIRKDHMPQTRWGMAMATCMHHTPLQAHSLR